VRCSLPAPPALPAPSALCSAAYGLTLVWALVAVFEQSESAAVRHSALAAIILLAACSIASVLRRPGERPLGDADVRQPLRPSLDGGP
jgi:hypothetical protein